MVLWLGHLLCEPELLVAWQIAMSGIVNVFGNSEDQWVVELIELVVGQLFIILNAVAIGISNLSTMPAFSFLLSLDLQQ